MRGKWNFRERAEVRGKWNLRERAEVHTGFWWGPGGKTPLGRPFRRKLEAKIKMNLQELEWESWTGLIWLRTVVNAVTIFRVS
jgi:hypothetical protein